MKVNAANQVTTLENSPTSSLGIHIQLGEKAYQLNGFISSKVYVTIKNIFCWPRGEKKGIYFVVKENKIKCTLSPQDQKLFTSNRCPFNGGWGGGPEHHTAPVNSGFRVLGSKLALPSFLCIQTSSFFLVFGRKFLVNALAAQPSIKFL